MICILDETVRQNLNAVIWLDAKRIAGAEGSALPTITDRHGITWGQSDPAKKPLLTHADATVGDAIRFAAAANKFLNHSDPGLSSTDKCTWFIVLNSTSAGWVWLLGVSPANGAISSDYNAVGKIEIAHWDGVTLEYRQSTADRRGTGWKCYCFRHDRAQAAGSELAPIFENGAFLAEGAELGTGTAGNFVAAAGTLGGSSTGFCMDASVAEFYVVRGSRLSDALVTLCDAEIRRAHKC